MDSKCKRHEARLDARIAKLKVRIEAAETLAIEREDRNKERFTAMESRVALSLASSDKAVSKAEDSTEKRFASVNEFRSTLADQSATLLPRSEYGVQHQSLVNRIEAQDKTLAVLQLAFSQIGGVSAGKKEGLSVVGALVLGVFGALATSAAVGSFIMMLFRH